MLAVEIDPVLAAELPRTVAARAPGLADRVAVVAADALHVEGGDLPAEPAVLVANLPYNVAVPVLLHLLAALPSLGGAWSWCRPRWRTGCARRPDHGCTARRR